MLLCHMRYLKLLRRLTRTDDLWKLDNADRHVRLLHKGWTVAISLSQKRSTLLHQ
ncbi:hypothetical protein IQ270_28930 [Microcoleus sp. LEGE 07076]|nr:hypothetical protein [Microcoleus sp. LEGE 07076]